MSVKIVFYTEGVFFFANIFCFSLILISFSQNRKVKKYKPYVRYADHHRFGIVVYSKH